MTIGPGNIPGPVGKPDLSTIARVNIGNTASTKTLNTAKVAQARKLFATLGFEAIMRETPDSLAFTRVAYQVEAMLIKAGMNRFEVVPTINRWAAEDLQPFANQHPAWGAVGIMPFDMAVPEDNGNVYQNGKYVTNLKNDELGDGVRLIHNPSGFVFRWNGDDINKASQVQEDLFDLSDFLSGLGGGGGGGGGTAAEPVFKGSDPAFVADYIRTYLRSVIGEAPEADVQAYVAQFLDVERSNFTNRDIEGPNLDPMQAIKEIVRTRADYLDIHQFRSSDLDEMQWLTNIIQNQRSTGINSELARTRGQNLARTGQTFGDPTTDVALREGQSSTFFQRAAQANQLVGSLIR